MSDTKAYCSIELPDGLRGIVTVLNTPFTEDNRLDLESLCRNVIRAVEAGVAGFLVPALAGEVGQLSYEERVELVRAVIETVRGKNGGKGEALASRHLEGDPGKSSAVPQPMGVTSTEGIGGQQPVQKASVATGEVSAATIQPGFSPSSSLSPDSSYHTKFSRLPWVIGSATASDRKERIRAAEALIRLGCEGILVWIPFTTEGEYLEQVREVASLKPAFLMLQDWDPAGSGLPVPLIRRLFEEVEEFKALKIETIPAGPKYTAVLQATGGKLHVSGGWAVTQMIEGLDRGVHAFMPTGMHEIYCEIYRRYAVGNRTGAVELFRQILPVLAFSNQHLDLSILFFKRLLWREGTYATPRCRTLTLAFDPIQEKTADELIELAIRIREKIRFITGNQ